MKKYNFIFFLVVFLIGTDTFLISPLLSTLSKVYGISTNISGWMVSAYAIGYAVFALIAGPLSDGRDRKMIMIAGFTAFTFSTLLCGFAFSFPLMVLFRFLAGLAASFVTTQIWAAIPTIAEKKQDVVKMIGIASSGLALAQIIGVPIGSILAGLTWHAPFFFISAWSLVILLVIRHFLPNMPDKRQKKTGPFRSYQTILRNRKAVLYLLGYLFFQIGSFCVFIFIGTWFSHSFGLTITEIGIATMIIGLGQFLGSFFGNKLAIRLGLAKSLLLGILALLMLYILTAFSANIFMAVALLMLVFLVNGFIYPIFMTLITSTSDSAKGTISSLANSTMYLGTTLAGILGGLLFTTSLHFTAIIIFTIVFELLSLLIYRFSGIFEN